MPDQAGRLNVCAPTAAATVAAASPSVVIASKMIIRATVPSPPRPFASTHRRELSVTRQVIKLGSSSIASRGGLALDVIAGLVSQVAAAQRSGHEIILVTSGAARLGRQLLAFEGPTAGAGQALQALVTAVRSAVQTGDYQQLADTLGLYVTPPAGPQAVETALPAAVGQPALMALYRQLAAAVGVEVCQILVSRSDLASARAMGDLGHLLREAVGRGLGGMGSKLSAAARAACCGVECIIGSAREPDVVGRSLNPRARMGSVIKAAGPQLEPGRRWIGGIAYSAGSVHVNREAEQSLRTGSTLFLSGVKRVDGDFAAGAVVELLDVRHPERLLGRGSVALPSAILRLLRALSPQEVACVLSILLRLRYDGSLASGEPGRARSQVSLLDPDAYKDCRELASGTSRASQEAYAQLASSSPDRVAELADSLLLAQPQLCTTFLLDKGFLHGQVPAEAAARRVVRAIHAVHRESLVVFPG